MRVRETERDRTTERAERQQAYVPAAAHSGGSTHVGSARGETDPVVGAALAHWRFEQNSEHCAARTPCPLRRDGGRHASTPRSSARALYTAAGHM